VYTPTENKAISAFMSTAVCAYYFIFFYPYIQFLFADHQKQQGLNSVTGNFFLLKLSTLLQPFGSAYNCLYSHLIFFIIECKLKYKK
jgi:cbb3-type cytochrome oxidase subunit 3